jgi:hypothetical protein
MRTWRMTCSALVLGSTLLALASVAAQGEAGDGVGRSIERPWTAVVEILEDGTDWWAGEVTFSGTTSDFGGHCSVPSDWLFHMRWEGLDSVFGHLTGAGSHCAQLAWGVDAEGAPTVMSIAFSDGVFIITWADGSTLGGNMIDMGLGFDAETGLITSSNFQYSVGEGNGRLAGATLYHVASCRYGSDEAVMAGAESILCTMQGTIRFDPLAGAGQRVGVTAKRD